MSLDVYLYADAPPTSPADGSGIFIRRNGQIVEITKQEWDRAFPGQEPVILSVEYGVDTCVYQSNITHNLGKMADEAGLYECLWRPDEHGLTKAKQLVESISLGLERLEADPDKFKTHNPPNGWGDYNGLVRFCRAYLGACKAYPEATIRVSR